MFKDKEEELKRLEEQLLAVEPEEEPEEEWDEALDEEEDEEEDEAMDEVTGKSNRGLVIAACLLAVGIAAVCVYLLIRYGGLLS